MVVSMSSRCWSRAGEAETVEAAAAVRAMREEMASMLIKKC
jgi:hypothetical protein